VLVLHPHYRRLGELYLGELGLPAWLMFPTCVAEILLGLRVALGSASSWVTAVQVVVVVGFTAILTALDPWLLVHPLGVLLKNVPLLAVILAAWLLEREGWTARARWVLRLGMASIWIAEGLFSKVFFQGQLQRDLVARSGLVPMEPGLFLEILGLCQAASGVGVLLLRGRPLLFLLLLQIVGLVVLPLLVVLQDPLWLVHPFGPITKNVPLVVGTVFVLLRG
jgi:hypothetical protein